VLAVDLDGTIVAVNTFPYFVRVLLRGLVRRGRLVAAARVAAALASRKLLGGSHSRLKAEVCRATPLLGERAIAAWVQAFLTRHVNGDVRSLVAQWPDTRVLCTAAPEAYAAAFGRALDFHVTQGSYLGPAGFVDNSGPRKAQRLREAQLAPVELAVTDDDDLDGPLLALARRRLLVVEGQLVPQEVAA
jgi:hypothetical protein